MEAKPTTKIYTTELEEVLAKEAEYLQARRFKNGLAPNEEVEIDAPIGIAISGGGVRSATLGLGMMQTFIKKGIFKWFDYMSTVSGGGYIGSCLTSLMSNEPDYEDSVGKRPITNTKYNSADIGLTAETSPFVAMNAQDDYKPASETKMNVRHQLHHLRTHGEYLTPDKGFFSWEVMRAVGSLLAGVWHNVAMLSFILIMFVSFHLGFFHLISEGVFIPILDKEEVVAAPLITPDLTPKSNVLPSEITEPLGDFLGILNWYKDNESLARQLREIWSSLITNYDFAFLFFTIGVSFGFIFILQVESIPKLIARAEYREKQSGFDPKIDKEYRRNSGYNLQRHITSKFKRFFSFVGIALGPIMGYLAMFFVMNFTTSADYWLMFTLPFCFSIGLFLVIYAVIPLIEFANYEHNQGLLFRSLYTGMQGGVFYGLVISFLMPIIIIFLFSASISFDILLSLFSGGFAYFFLANQFLTKDGNGWFSKLMRRARNPLLNIFTVLFITFLLSTTAHFILSINSSLNKERWIVGEVYEINLFAVCLFGIAAFLFIIIGHTANINKLSFHYFYRDRLSEAYLRTDARVKRPDTLQSILYQGMPLINLRNHVGLKLKDLGEGNGKGPYHLLNAALNLQGTNDLVKRSLKSDHFLFSKYYIGSESTGYMRTEKYRWGYTRLAVAMTISAAAVSSAMGNMSFAAQNFFMTLFNLRTGYWIQNPWYENLKQQNLVYRSRLSRYYRKAVGWISPYRTFWPMYIIRELIGRTNARSPRVYVSDGGHTGDNLGLLPLLERKCKVIVVCDFEEDKTYAFGSFNHALRMANVRHNIIVDIDLESMIPKKEEGSSLPLCGCTFTKGHIQYNDKSTGVLIYLKSGVSRDAQGKIPVTVFNYLKSNLDFPHQSTIDQYFDDEQFEAYRILGNHIAGQAVGMIQEEMNEK